MPLWLFQPLGLAARRVPAKPASLRDLSAVFHEHAHHLAVGVGHVHVRKVDWIIARLVASDSSHQRASVMSQDMVDTCCKTS